jgi:O-antigen ligase
MSCILLVDMKNMPAGEMDYQKLWIGRMSVVFAMCTLTSVSITNQWRKLRFASCVSWSLIILGGVEACWGLSQIYGISVSNHKLYALTGSFYNPGPYSGYLAVVLPICLHEWLSVRKRQKRSPWQTFRMYTSASLFLLIIGVLPAGMSRTAWIAGTVASLWVYGASNSWGAKLKAWSGKRRKAVLLACGCVSILMIIAGTLLFRLKENSANGRLFMWKISCLAIMERPIAGHGAGSFVPAYGNAQERYFANGDYDATEERVAGSPQYAFNEYLQVAVEYGLPALIVILGIISFCLWRGIKEKRVGICGGVISFLIFAFASYPISIPAFALTCCFLLAACVVNSRISLIGCTLFIGLYGAYCLKSNQYEACKAWKKARHFYTTEDHPFVRKEYERLYPKLKDRGQFLFEYGRSLNKIKEYEHSTKILEEAMKYSNDPMLLNIIGKNHQELGEYRKVEECLIRSIHRLPDRIYPYYLLAKLYAVPEFHHPDKLKQMVELVLTKEPKVQSTAIQEMREEVKRLK